MQDINVWTGTGRLTADPELRATTGGTSTVTLRLAFNTSRKNSATGQWEDKANYINVIVWGGQAESCAKNLVRGQQVTVSGRLELREWVDNNQQKRSAHEVTANQVQFGMKPRNAGVSAPLPEGDTPPVY